MPNVSGMACKQQARIRCTIGRSRSIVLCYKYHVQNLRFGCLSSKIVLQSVLKTTQEEHHQESPKKIALHTYSARSKPCFILTILTILFISLLSRVIEYCSSTPRLSQSSPPDHTTRVALEELETFTSDQNPSVFRPLQSGLVALGTSILLKSKHSSVQKRSSLST